MAARTLALPMLARLAKRDHSPNTAVRRSLSVRFDEHIATNFA